ncbi:MAG: MFS transporter, partial [Alphaproteobacteria bacterium]|nr:MFS transporter [Alphaproteobacteria bacterium]
MQPAMTNTGKSTAPAATTGLVPFVVALFFVWGFATVLNDTLIPKLKALFALNYTEVMLTQFCFFIGYFLFSVPAGRMLERLGYMRTIVIGLCVMAAGCLMFSPAAMIGVYPVFLAALFVVAAGITILQVAANPFIAVLGPEETSHSRLNLAQAFNSLGTFVGPWVGASLLLSHQFVAPDPRSLSASALSAIRIREAQSIQFLFVTIAAVLAVLALVFWGKRRAAAAMGQENPAKAAPVWRVVLEHPRLALGVVSIFVYVGAEVSIGSIMTNYLMQASVLGVAAVTAGHLVSLYWGG